MGAGTTPVVDAQESIRVWLQTVGEVLAGKEKIVSHVGASQYNSGGVASCGLAGLNFVRLVFERAKRGLRGGALLKDVLSRRTSEEILSICSRWRSDDHLEVEDIFAVPLFSRALSLVNSTYGEPSFERFRAVLSDLQSIPNDYAAVLITRPPEIVTCCKLPIINLPIGRQTIFVIFDSHPRTSHPNGAGFVLNTSLDATASHLDNLLAVDGRLLVDSSLQWQTQLLANFSGHFFVAKENTGGADDLAEAILESSLVVLRLQAKVADLKLQNSSLTRDRQPLETELGELKGRYRSIQRKLDASPRLCAQCSPKSSSSRKSTSSPDPQSIAGPSKPSAKNTSSPKKPHALNAPEHSSSSANTVRRPNKNYPAASSLRSAPSYAQTAQSDVDYLVAVQLQRDWEREAVLNAQREFEEEHAQLLTERAALHKVVQRVFECGVCFDEHPEDDVARVADCGHPFCRDCMNGYVISKLKDKLYPITCPTCMTDAARAVPGVVTDDMVQTLGLDDKQYQILQELQIAPLSVLLQCRKCKESVFVDREDYEAEPVLVCPFPTCDHVWCKACQQTIVIGGAKHSCDGSTELEDLMKQQGWKHCPTCKTPFQKSEGCNHMTCISPSCNTHFCYLCGETIVRSAIRREIESAKSAHYAGGCPLFDVPAETE
ncbi:hypothetical protein C8R47DRAFT_961601 [Mycena vitilis]|nr:hypothetical protein C8R47DRAFT_961601 [Mycena vitilis]